VVDKKASISAVKLVDYGVSTAWPEYHEESVGIFSQWLNMFANGARRSANSRDVSDPCVPRKNKHP
jgi:hypothetical protein